MDTASFHTTEEPYFTF